MLPVAKKLKASASESTSSRASKQPHPRSLLASDLVDSISNVSLRRLGASSSDDYLYLGRCFYGVRSPKSWFLCVSSASDSSPS